MDRRGFLKQGAAAAGAAFLSADAAGAQDPELRRSPFGQELIDDPFRELEEATISDLQAAMDAGKTSSSDLVAHYLARIDAMNVKGPGLRAVIETNPDAPDIASALDEERKARGVRGPLHGIPVLVKDNIDTADRMQTTAGSYALLGTRPGQDATVAKRLREAGAVILGKANLSEWANIRSSHSSSGWSARGGQCRNPYVLTHSPCGSSSGSAVAVAANLCVVALGTETDGSIVCPSHINGIVGIKPTVGLTSRAGVVPISHTQDTVGVHARTVHDAAILLKALTGVDPRDSATAPSAGPSHSDYTHFLDRDGLKGMRIGIPRKVFFGYSPQADAIAEEAIRRMSSMGATIVDPADIPTASDLASGNDEITVLLYDLKADMQAYLSERVPNEAFHEGMIARTLADLIGYNTAHASQEMAYFGQDLFEQAQAKGPLTDPDYLKALETCKRLARTEGIDAVMEEHKLDALAAPTGNPAWPIDLVNGDHFMGASSQPAAMAGYPLVTVPAGFTFGLPVGITFMARAWSEPTLIKIAYAFEQATMVRRLPRFLAEAETM